MDKYTIEAGRAIYRNGLPFVSIGRSAAATEYWVSPLDADTFARAIPAMIDALRELLAVAENADYPFRWEAIARAHDALALLPVSVR